MALALARHHLSPKPPSHHLYPVTSTTVSLACSPLEVSQPVLLRSHKEGARHRPRFLSWAPREIYTTGHISRNLSCENFLVDISMKNDLHWIICWLYILLNLVSRCVLSEYFNFCVATHFICYWNKRKIIMVLFNRFHTPKKNYIWDNTSIFAQEK